MPLTGRSCTWRVVYVLWICAVVVSICAAAVETSMVVEVALTCRVRFAVEVVFRLTFTPLSVDVPKPVPVAAGSVGIAGAQTGIYPLDSPGGWHIIGRTPVKQFDAATKELVKLKVGDRVQFYAISKEEYEDRVENV